MKKTCKGCYATITKSHPLQGGPYDCKLGYQTDGAGHPKEECPKPKSWVQLYSVKSKDDRRWK